MKKKMKRQTIEEYVREMLNRKGKNRIFYCSAECGVPIPGTVESTRTAEIRRDAKHEALISLILNAGLTKEYHEWLMENGYE